LVQHFVCRDALKNDVYILHILAQNYENFNAIKLNEFKLTIIIIIIIIITATRKRTVRKVSGHFEYLENRRGGLDVT
jgi:hypothetical protein